ncbi:unnamed protein product [Dovyalis caffra]|uniref:Uncharacterized protein n=1 Tax=Dovyalis caffra TaxID=77055 RepID=A0AAV1QZA4_9ROSI|nr:unnamed protein product [Dovyalis caffra]
MLAAQPALAGISFALAILIMGKPRKLQDRIFACLRDVFERDPGGYFRNLHKK